PILGVRHAASHGAVGTWPSLVAPGDIMGPTVVVSIGDAMYGGIVRLVAAEGLKSDLLNFLAWYAHVCRTVEPGTLRFDAWEAPNESHGGDLYEAYADQAAGVLIQPVERRRRSWSASGAPTG